MCRNCFLSPAIVLCCIFCITLDVNASDWTQWGRTNNRNMVSQEKNLPSHFEITTQDSDTQPGATNIKWTARLGTYAYGNPTVSNGKVFVGTDAQTLTADPRFKYRRGGLVKCFAEDTGKLLWQLPVPVRTQLPEGALFTHQHLGICSSPIVDGNRLYIVTSAAEIACLDVNGQADGNDGPYTDDAQYMVGKGKTPVELNNKDGDIIWLFDPVNELEVCPHDAASCSALIVGDMLYTGTSNGIDKAHKKIISPLAPSLIVLDKNTGKLLATDNEKIGTRMYHTQWASPSSAQVAGKTLIFFGGGDGICYAFEAITEIPDKPVFLKKVWSCDCNPDEYKYENGKEIPFYRGDKRKSNGPNKNDGNYIGPNQIIATPVFCDGKVYVAIGQDPAHGRGKGLLLCIDATKTGDVTETAKVWTYDGLDRTIATVAVADGLVYANDVAGRLHCLDAATGKPCWVYETNQETWGSPLIADGKVYFGNKKDFYIMAHAKELKLLSKQELTSTVYSTPITANGVLYVASNRHLWAISNSVNAK